MNLTTTYLGLELPHPLMPGASPLAEHLDGARRLEDAGAAAIVMNSLFEEQILGELAAEEHYDLHGEAYGEALSYFPSSEVLGRGPEGYLEHLRRVAEAVSVPVIGSLNGTHPGTWTEYARWIEQAGAAALELNVFDVVVDPSESAAAVEDRLVALVREVAGSIEIPLALKLGPSFTALAHLAGRLAEAGAEGLVIFNRFYQPDLDIQELRVRHSLRLSTSAELLERLRWLAILDAVHPALDLAVTGGVHDSEDAVKALMAGADAVQIVSLLLAHGESALGRVLRGLEDWLDEHEYDSLDQLRGSMNLDNCPDPTDYARGNYARVLASWPSLL